MGEVELSDYLAKFNDSCLNNLFLNFEVFCSLLKVNKEKKIGDYFIDGFLRHTKDVKTVKNCHEVNIKSTRTTLAFKQMHLIPCTVFFYDNGYLIQRAGCLVTGCLV